ncbi:MAG: hypothetical protein U0414_19220 [Polyangiaceae bacterium]
MNSSWIFLGSVSLVGLACAACDDSSTSTSAGGAASGSTSSSTGTLSSTSGTSTGSASATATSSSASGTSSSTGSGTLCTPGEQQPCYSGPDGTNGVGVCKGGMATCNAAGDGFGPCAGEIVPTVEDCATVADESCDGAGCGDALWSRALGSGLISSAGAAMDIAPWRGGVIVGGAIQSSNPMLLNGTGWIRFDAGGVIVETKVLEPSFSANSIRLAAGADGGLVYAVSGASAIDFGGGPLSGIVLARLDAMGALAWTKAVAASAFSDFNTAVDQAASGTVALVGVSLDGVDFGGGMIPAGGYFATFDGATGALLHQSSLGASTQYPAVAALSDGRFAIAQTPSLTIFQADHTTSCTSAITLGTSPSIAETASGDILVASTKGAAVELVSISPMCAASTPTSISTASPKNPRVAIAEGGDIFLSWASSNSHVVTRRDAMGSQIWLKTFPTSGTNDDRAELFDGISPIVLSLNLSGPIDYGNGPLASGVAVARLAP